MQKTIKQWRAELEYFCEKFWDRHPMVSLGLVWLGAMALIFAIGCGYEAWHDRVVNDHYRSIEYAYAHDHGWDFNHLSPEQYQQAMEFAQKTLDELGMDQ
jgi:hypothetical protein